MRYAFKPPYLWKVLASFAVIVGVASSVVLMSAAYGVHHEITHKLANPALVQQHIVNVGLIDRVLSLLTKVVVGAMLTETAVAIMVLGTTVMQSRERELANRATQGASPWRLIREFLGTIMVICIIAGAFGEMLGYILCRFVFEEKTVLPIGFNFVSVWSAFPVTVVLALLATALPAWKYANKSPAISRKSSA
jgi:cell division protein FtsX